MSCTQTLEISEKIFPVAEDPEMVSDEYMVSLKDIDSYVNFKVLDAKYKGQELSVREISPILSKKGDVSLYIINYNEGWDAITASNNFVESRMIDPDTPLDTIKVDFITGHWELMGGWNLML